MLYLPDVLDLETSLSFPPVISDYEGFSNLVQKQNETLQHFALGQPAHLSMEEKCLVGLKQFDDWTINNFLHIYVSKMFCCICTFHN